MWLKHKEELDEEELFKKDKKKVEEKIKKIAIEYICSQSKLEEDNSWRQQLEQIEYSG